MTNVEEQTSSATSTPAAAAARGKPAPQAGRRAGGIRPARIATVIVLLAGLAGSVLARMWAMALQDSAAATGPYASSVPADNAGAARSSSFGNMDSFALALLLGGLRGPLVMFLWVSSEAQKNEKDLEDFDTKIEWIRRLQPEFDTVHIFQMWNKAYNVSVQLASLPDRYSAILDALEYGKNMDASRPNDINILLAIDQIYCNKLGTTTGDKNYYIREVRRETMSRANSRKISVGVTPRNVLPPMLDDAGNLLPDLVQAKNPAKPGELSAIVVVPKAHVGAFLKIAADAGVATSATPSSIAAGGTLAPGEFIASKADNAEIQLGDREYQFTDDDARRIEARGGGDLPGILFIYGNHNDGAELQYLARYQPYPYGLSPLALGYNYGKRAQVLMTEGRQKPVQVGKAVVDSKPAVELRQWSEDEWDRATNLEIKALGRTFIPTPDLTGPGTANMVRNHKEAVTADFTVGTPLPDAESAKEALPAALNSYALTARLCRDSRAQYVRHLLNPEYSFNRIQDYSSTLDSLRAEEVLVLADHDFLQAVSLPDGAQRNELMKSSMDFYRQAVLAYKYLLLRYYMPVEELAKVIPAKYPHLSAQQFRLKLHEFLMDDPAGFEALYKQLDDRLNLPNAYDPNSGERNDYGHYIFRASTRYESLRSALQPAGATQPATAPATGPVTSPADIVTPSTLPTTAPVVPGQ